MSFQGFYTTKGLALAAKIAAGTKLTITKVTAGSGETAKSATALTGEKQTLTAGTAAVSGQTAVLPVTLAETSVSAAYELTELGVYAQDPDAGEILFQVFRMDTALPLTAGGTNAYRFYLKQTVGAAGITVTCSPAGLLVDEDLQPLRAAVAKKPDTLLNYTILHVAKTGSDETGNGSSAAPYLTIQKALDSLPKLLMVRAEIEIHAGTYDEDVQISGFIGNEMLIIRATANEDVSIRSIYAVSCRTRLLRLTGFTLTGQVPIGTSNKWGCALYMEDCSTVEISNLTCTRTLAAQVRGAFTFGLTYLVRMANVVLSNQPVAIESMESTIYLAATVTGENNTVAIRSGSAWSGRGSFVQKGGSALAGEEQKLYGGQIW